MPLEKVPYEKIKKRLLDDKLLVEYCKTRDIELRNEIVKKNLFIVDIIIRKYINLGVEYQDLYQIASLALVNAINNYDISYNCVVSSYVSPYIVGKIKNYLRDNSRTIRLPRKHTIMRQKMQPIIDELSNKLYRSPTPKEIALEMGVSEEEVLQALESISASTLTSLETLVSNDSTLEVSHVIGAEDKNFEKILNSCVVEKLLSILNPLEKQIIVERYSNQLSQQALGEKIGIAQMQVSRIERKAKEKLIKYAKEKMYLEE